MDPYLKPAYAQCWSKTEESDTLLRAYSRVVKDPHFGRNIDPRQEGVRVRTSVSCLIGASQDWARALSGVSCFIGAVQYGTAAEIKQHLVNLVDQFGPAKLGVGQLRAKLLLLKRKAFSHENEIRLICVDERKVEQLNVLRVSVAPNELIEEVTFDPRLPTFERKEREEAIRSLGYTGQFGSSDLYQKLFIELPLPNGWKEGGASSPAIQE